MIGSTRKTFGEQDEENTDPLLEDGIDICFLMRAVCNSLYHDQDHQNSKVKEGYWYNIQI